MRLPMTRQPEAAAPVAHKLAHTRRKGVATRVQRGGERFSKPWVVGSSPASGSS